MLATGGLRIDQAPPLHLPFRFFGTGMVFVWLSGCVLLFWGDELLIAPLLPITVAMVHLLVLGWLLMTVMGAMIQMIPVLAGIPVPWPGTIPWVHGVLTLGVVAFFAGIMTDWGHPWLLYMAQIGVGVAVVGFLIPIAMALLSAPAKHPTVPAMRIAMVALTGTLIFGVIFLGEYLHGFMEVDRYILVGIHLTWGLLGTMGTLIMGVSFQVLPMFYMTPPFRVRQANWILLGMGIFLLVMPVALFWSELVWPLYVAALPLTGAIGLYGIEIFHLFKQKKRQFVDATLWFWRLGFFSVVVALVLLALWPVLADERLRYGFGIFYLLGWVGAVMIGMLHKIIPFLVWFHRFSPVVGLQEVPMMDDLTPLRTINAQVVVYAGTLLLMALAVLTGWDWAVRLGGAGLIGVSGVSLYALWFAMRIEAPKISKMPDFASFFKDPIQPAS